MAHNLLVLVLMTLTFSCRGEISSGTVVTYNDRQEILCQKCTDIALHEEAEDVPPHPSPSSTEGTTSRPSSDRKVRINSLSLNSLAQWNLSAMACSLQPEFCISLLKSKPELSGKISATPKSDCFRICIFISITFA